MKEFFAAIRAGDRTAVGKLLDQEPELARATNPDDFGAPPITTALAQGNEEMIDFLIARGADINQKSDWPGGPFAPIHYMFWAERAYMGEFLIERGAFVDAHAAAGMGDMDRLLVLVDQDPAVVHERGSDGQYPLHFAKDPAVAQFLLDRGAAIDAKCVDHQSTAAQWAVKDRPELVRFLVEHGAEPDLFMECAAGMIDRVRMRGADLWKQKLEVPLYADIYRFAIGSGSTPLHVATRFEQLEVAELIGGDVNVRGGYDDATALHNCAWHDKIEGMAWLLDRGAGIDVRSGELHNNTPLGWACVAGSVNAVKLLLDRGAEVLDIVRGCAETGARGEFLGWTPRATPENHQAIRTMVCG